MMRLESMPAPPIHETPPLAPYDPPDPAPQAAAWRQALKVIGYNLSSEVHPVRVPLRRATRHRC